MKNGSYVLVTAARNEEKYIEKTIISVVNQSILPLKWMIVNDNSTDATDVIVRSYEKNHDFIKLIKIENKIERNFASKVFALEAGFKELKDYAYRFIGILDADISLKPDYYEMILREFRANQKLGIAGGILFDCPDENKTLKRYSSFWSVPGGIQLFRRECFEKIGGIMPLKLGEEDHIAEVKARMNGYEVLSFPKIIGFHHRLTGTASSKYLSMLVTNGVRDYYIGSYLWFEVAKCIKKVNQRPYLIGSVLRFCGFMWATLTRLKRDIPEEIVQYLRQDQKKKILAAFHFIFKKN